MQQITERLLPLMSRFPFRVEMNCLMKIMVLLLQIESANSHSMPLPTDHQQQPHFFQLPPSNPYGHFLKAAGC
ncbi:hypothetical protein AB3S75_038507 [Citrus x aurantiifolia]